MDVSSLKKAEVMAENNMLAIRFIKEHSKFFFTGHVALISAEHA